MVGQTLSQGAGAGDALIAKWNSAGTFQWQRSLGGSGADSAIRGVVDASGNIYFVGTTASAGGRTGPPRWWSSTTTSAPAPARLLAPAFFISHGAPTFALEPGQAGPALTAP